MCDFGFDSGSDVSFDGDCIGEGLDDSSYDVGENIDNASELDALSMDFETAPETLDMTNEPETFGELPSVQPGDAEAWDMSDVPSFEEHLAEMEGLPEVESEDASVEGDLIEMTDNEIYDIPHEDIENQSVESLDDLQIPESEASEALSGDLDAIPESELDTLELPPEIQGEDESFETPEDMSAEQIIDAENVLLEEQENIEQDAELLTDEAQDIPIDFEAVYDSINSGIVGEGFENIQIDEDAERLDSSLENFEESTWESLPLDEQKASMQNLADYVVDVVGFENPPAIEYYYNPREGDYGAYNPERNTLNVNEYMLYNSSEAADTIAHELWHAHQYECASDPHSTLDYQYQYNFDNYISPKLGGQEAYEAQLVEAEARAFASQFKGRLFELSGR